ncbi:hypothetical protein SAMN06265360_108142 [Haloechinothrix alba]|uniref:Uncharacterized protein n=1 Tax=Haloechinothrix alba TaxID=664784 RepID=A0A238X066_9PSEU|nr:hypothetical protein [Haloechinothrix alba]SNR52216.1 hypothetical protein SAMN06265360_108142 [Haloechinothrix alba]
MSQDHPAEHPRFSADLIGLDPDDQEARAFAEHLDKMERSGPSFTIEGSLQGVADFAESSTKLGGPRRYVVALVVTLILLGILAATWQFAGGLAAWLTG